MMMMRRRMTDLSRIEQCFEFEEEEEQLSLHLMMMMPKLVVE